MSKELSTEIQEYHKLQADIAKLQVQKESLSRKIIDSECPYKKGQNICYLQSYFDNKKRYGKIERISFEGVDSYAIDNKWIITVRPTKKDFMPINKVVNHSVTLGKNKGDQILTT